MKTMTTQQISKLTDLPNVGKAIANYLNIIGIHEPSQIIGRNGYQLYEDLCRITNKNHDPCVIDVFVAIVDFMEGGEPDPWWKFTAERKKHMAKGHKE